MEFQPTIHVQAPDGWLAKESITLLEPSGGANVIASSEPLDTSATSETYAAQQGDLLNDEFPGYRELSFEPTELFGGRSGFVRKFEWLPEAGEQVTQFQLYYAKQGRGYTATATTPSRTLPQFETALLSILNALALSN
jgi:hypothetical protein